MLKRRGRRVEEGRRWGGRSQQCELAEVTLRAISKRKTHTHTQTQHGCG